MLCRMCCYAAVHVCVCVCVCVCMHLYIQMYIHTYVHTHTHTHTHMCIYTQKKRKRGPRRTTQDTEWAQEYRERFSYVKDAKNREFSRKDTVVPGSTMLRASNGLDYNAYLTRDKTSKGQGDEDEEEVVRTEFFGIKLVEAGGLMKGEKWHLVIQQGTVGTSKPNCKVDDFSDLREAKTEFERQFYNKTNNSWAAGPDAFRTFPYPAFNLVEDSDEEAESESDEEAELADTAGARLWNLEVQGLVKKMMGAQSLKGALHGMHVDTEKLPLQRLKRRRVHTALAQLDEIQKLLSKGDRQSGKDIEKVSKMSQSVRRLVPLTDSFEGAWQIDTVPALQESTRMLEELGEVCVAASMRKRVRTQLQDAKAQQAEEGESSEAPTPKKIDALYRSLRSSIEPLAPSHTAVHEIRKLVELPAQQEGAETGDARDESGRTNPLLQLQVDKVFAINCAGAEAKYAPFKRLKNRMLLWKGARESSMASILSQGLHVPAPEAPSAAYPFGTVTDAISHTH